MLKTNNLTKHIIAVQENKYKKGGDAEACRASSDPEGILSYVEDDDAAMCGYARRTFAVIFWNAIVILAS